ncbi:MAG: Mut7-C RNAse domain-containing protein [Nitrososphaerales archaeon]
MADAMFGSLARKTRALGFDTVYYSDGDDSGIIRIAESEGRVILTADRSLAERAHSGGTRVLLISGTTDSRRLVSLLVAARSSGISLVRGGPLCSLCDGELQRVKKTNVTGRIPLAVERRHRLFFKCLACGQFYWRGSHWKKLRWLERILVEVPVATVS